LSAAVNGGDYTWERPLGQVNVVRFCCDGVGTAVMSGDDDYVFWRLSCSCWVCAILDATRFEQKPGKKKARFACFAAWKEGRKYK
jgi:hypothetical protein